MQAPPTSHRLQRQLLAGFCGLTVVTAAQPLLVPRQPALPSLAADASLPAGWQRHESAGSLPRLRQRAHRPLWSAAAVGASTVISGPQGQLLQLTPMASWNQKGLDPGAVVQAQSQSQSKDRPPTPCLTPQGGLASSQEDVVALQRQAEPLPWAARLKFMLVPPRTRSYNCVLLTTNAPGLLQDIPATRQLGIALSRAIRWPPPPGH